MSLFSTLMADYKHFLHCFNWLPWSIMSAGLGKTKFWTCNCTTVAGSNAERGGFEGFGLRDPSREGSAIIQARTESRCVCG